MRTSGTLVALICASGCLLGASPAAADTVKEALARRHARSATSPAEQPGVSEATRAAIARRHATFGAPITLPAQPGVSSKDLWAGLLAGNHRFVLGTPERRDLVALRQTLVQGQHPDAIVLGCSDSRVSPELVFDEGLGGIFVVRSAGNVADSVALGSIEYAVEHLHAKLVVVLGHEGCGAVAAAASGQRMPTANLEAVVARIRPALEPLRAAGSGERLARLGVQANVERSARQILAGSPLLEREVAAGRVALVKAVYRLGTGEVAALP